MIYNLYLYLQYMIYDLLIVFISTYQTAPLEKDALTTSWIIYDLLIGYIL